MANARIVKVAFFCGHERIYSDRDLRVSLNDSATHLIHTNGWEAEKAHPSDMVLTSQDPCGQCRRLPTVEKGGGEVAVQAEIDRTKLRTTALVVLAAGLGRGR